MSNFELEVIDIKKINEIKRSKKVNVVGHNMIVVNRMGGPVKPENKVIELTPTKIRRPINHSLPYKISLFDHKFVGINMGTEIECSCGKEFSTPHEFYQHQKEELNKQLEKIGVVVEVV